MTPNKTASSTPWAVIALMLALLLGGCVTTHPANNDPAPGTSTTPQKTKPAPSPTRTKTPPTVKYIYTSREPVIGVYITTKGTPRAEQSGWSTTPAGGTDSIWYANGAATDSLRISSTAIVTRIVWVLPDGSQRIQEGDLTYYDPETQHNR